MNRTEWLNNPKRIVIKIGSALMALGENFAVHLATEIAGLKNAEVIVVSSGTIALGLPILGYAKRPTEICQLQAAASAGQFDLMRRFSHAFAQHQLHVAQVLLTHADLANRERFLNARHAMQEMLRCKVVPIVNENDTVATDEIRLGDNDNLSAQVASLMQADLLIILTTVDGLFSANPETDPNAKRISIVEKPSSVKDLAKGASKVGLSVGGMHTKIEAAIAATKRGIPVIIAQGQTALKDLLIGKDIGTIFIPNKKVQSRKHWIGFTLRPKGFLTIDKGAEKAVIEGKKSLLPSGIVKIKGHFPRGAMVEILSSEGLALARGLVAYPSDEIQQMKGLNTQDIAKKLGYSGGPEIVHRDDMIILEA